MRFTRNRIIILVIIFVTIIVIAIGACWGYRRYLSPRIQPSIIEYPVRGVDISAHNGNVDFEKLKLSGIDFVMLKATEGVSFIDKKFEYNYQKAREAGLRVGVYHFFRFDCDGRVQAFHFLNTIGDRSFDFPLALDVEESGNPAGHDRKDIVNNLREAIDHLELRSHDVMLYTNKRGYSRFISRDFPDYPLWICSFSDPPGPDCWYMWQFTHRGNVPGVNGQVDINILH
ncbi:MAG: hypothetical protein K2G40_00740 [Muribaculaceae bacterium]|nr:hypothetical protein [Muribaculaceae bacterium]